MRVIALRSFAARVAGKLHTGRAGVEMEMPEGADWLDAGLVAAVDQPETGTKKEPAPRKAAVDPPETATKPEPAPRKPGAEDSPGEQPATAVKGIGQKTAETLAEHGVETVADLAAAEDLPEDFAEWQVAAQEMLR
ncbi:MAG: helix-hairpin-helix domain-containing protein [bacterium]